MLTIIDLSEHTWTCSMAVFLFVETRLSPATITKACQYRGRPSLTASLNRVASLYDRFANRRDSVRLHVKLTNADKFRARYHQFLANEIEIEELAIRGPAPEPAAVPCPAPYPLDHENDPIKLVPAPTAIPSPPAPAVNPPVAKVTSTTMVESGALNLRFNGLEVSMPWTGTETDSLRNLIKVMKECL